MTIITIPNKSLIRWLPKGTVGGCLKPSLAKVDSSRVLMTYEAQCEHGLPVGAACYLDEEFVANAQSNTILSLPTRRNGSDARSFRLFCDGATVRSIYSNSCFDAIAELLPTDRPGVADFGLIYLDCVKHGPAFPFVWNGTLMALTASLEECLMLFREGEFWSCRKIGSVKVGDGISIGAVSGFVPSGDGWITFLTLPAKGFIAIHQARLTVDQMILSIAEMCGVLPGVDWLGTPMRHGEGWALPFDDGSGVCKIALIADSEIEST